MTGAGEWRCRDKLVIESPIWDSRTRYPILNPQCLILSRAVFSTNFKQHSDPETLICTPPYVLNIISKHLVIGRVAPHRAKFQSGRGCCLVLLPTMVRPHLLTKHHCYSIVANNVNHQHPRNSLASQKCWKTGNFQNFVVSNARFSNFTIKGKLHFYSLPTLHPVRICRNRWKMLMKESQLEEIPCWGVGGFLCVAPQQ